MTDKKNRKEALKKSLLENSLLEMSGGATTLGSSTDILNGAVKMGSSSASSVTVLNASVGTLRTQMAALNGGTAIPDALNKAFNTLTLPVAVGKSITTLVGTNGITDPNNDYTFVATQTPSLGKNRVLTLFDLITKDDGTFLSSDVDAIMNRLSSLAQFKHLPSISHLTGGGGGRRNRSRKSRK